MLKRVILDKRGYMREVIAEIEAWRKEGKRVAIATNVKKDGASLRPLGAKMAMTSGYEIAGSLTGGCIESAVYEEAQAVIHSGAPRLVRYGVPDDERPWEIGLSCGSSLEVFIESLGHRLDCRDRRSPCVEGTD